MICVRAAQPLFTSPLSLAIRTTKHTPINLPFSSQRSFSSITMSSSTPQNQIIEHIVLFKVKPDTDSTKITSMINNLNNLITLPQVIHISAAPLHRITSSTFTFTHVLHSRYGSKEDLNAYSAHTDHVRVVKQSVLPICEDVMAVDWIAHKIPATLTPPPGSVAKLTLIKVKENVQDEDKLEIVDVIKGLSERFRGIGEITVGENFSPARAKGYSIASIAYFKDLDEIESVDDQKEIVNLEKDKVRDYIDSTIVVEFVVPSSFVSGL